jgi:hypothetical protein
MDKILSKDDLLITKIINFYNNIDNLNIFLEIVLQKNKISLRLLDWLVTNFSKKNNICYLLNNENYYVFKGYKSQLKAYSKKYCDPFCRRERVLLDYSETNNIQLIYNIEFNNELNNELNNKNKIITTIGQLNFFKYAISHGIIEYIKNNLILIENDMNDTLKEREYEKKFINISNIKRKELSKSGNKSVNITIVNAVIKFI